MNMTLIHNEAGWSFRDTNGRLVRVSITSPRTYATEAAALDEVRAQGFSFNGKRLTERP